MQQAQTLCAGYVHHATDCLLKWSVQVGLEENSGWRTAAGQGTGWFGNRWRTSEQPPKWAIGATGLSASDDGTVCGLDTRSELHCAHGSSWQRFVGWNQLLDGPSGGLFVMKTTADHPNGILGIETVTARMDIQVQLATPL